MANKIADGNNYLLFNNLISTGLSGLVQKFYGINATFQFTYIYGSFEYFGVNQSSGNIYNSYLFNNKIRVFIKDK